MKSEYQIRKKISICRKALQDTAHVNNIYMPEIRKIVESDIRMLKWVLEDKK